jgi:hypothetical protein
MQLHKAVLVRANRIPIYLVICRPEGYSRLADVRTVKCEQLTNVIDKDKTILRQILAPYIDHILTGYVPSA